jgi:hypothetical protein
VEPQLVQHVLDVRAHRVGGQEEVGCGLVPAHAGDQAAQHVGLALGEAVEETT